MKYVCPFCYKPMPQGYEPSAWSCCGEVGHAIALGACPKCSAEFFDPPKPCEVCGHKLSHPQLSQAKLTLTNQERIKKLRQVIAEAGDLEVDFASDVESALKTIDRLIVALRNVCVAYASEGNSIRMEDAHYASRALLRELGELDA